MAQPLAERLRPKTLEDYIGQKHLVGPDAILRKMIEAGRISSFILWGPPGVGKTTLLRSLAGILASGERAVRVSVIDTRGELGYSLGDANLCIDMLSGYPKHIGISIAARTLSPQVIICDEIGSRAEADAICR